MAYSEFFNFIDKAQIKTIFELGSRDLIDAIQLSDHFNNSKVYAFECNPDCLIECNKQLAYLDNYKKQNIVLVDKAVSLTDDKVSFYPFDLTKYDNMGSSSMLKIDFSLRNRDDPDYNRENPQKEITVNGVRLDTFINDNDIQNIDLLCIDLQGYELNAIKSLGVHLHKVKYIITECSIQSTYTHGSTFEELNDYLNEYNFVYHCSNRFGNQFPHLNIRGFSEFDSLFINYSTI
uniref:Methyltransferase FkbM domain-containing protein n=1 Tax=viral metagenome TaxID=1070528 RepID=A0A6C0DQ21_9ZZZZ